MTADRGRATAGAPRPTQLVDRGSDQSMIVTGTPELMWSPNHVMSAV